MGKDDGRYGLTIPLEGMPLIEQRELIRELPTLGYTDVWTSETNGVDAFTPLALTSCWAPTLHLGAAAVSAFTRGPALLAMSVAGLVEAAPYRFQLGIGTSTEVIVEQWNGIPFKEPYRRVRDVVRFLKAALR